MALRSLICTVVGHVDHGKTSLLDAIRGSAVTATEAGKITQAIGASIIPLETIERLCGPLLKKKGMALNLPGLLFIDTPGHAAFVNLRRRGGALADIAVLVIDINEGFRPQTMEGIEILKANKTPFVVAANKIDLLRGWATKKELPLVQSIAQQGALELFESKLYELVGKLHELGFASERFDRVEDFAKQVAIIPVSAHTREGIPELLMVLAGLAQRYLEKHLQVDILGGAKGTVLELKEQQGLGTTVDVILYDGMLHVNDTIVIGGVVAPVVTKVRALLEPLPLVEMRTKKAAFRQVAEVTAATGVKIAAPLLEHAAAGMPLRSCAAGDVERVAREVQEEVEEVLVQTDPQGVIVKADALGSVEALALLLREHGIPIKAASIGRITKNDVAEAEMMGKEQPFYGTVIGFNTGVLQEAQEALAAKQVKLITSDVIYDIIEQYGHWKEEKKKAIELAELSQLVRGGKIRILPGYVFRQSNPAVVGVEVLAGRIRAGEPAMNASGKRLSVIRDIQEEQKSISVAEAGKRVAVALEHVMVGRQVHEGDVLYTDVPEEHFRTMKKLKHYVTGGDALLLKEIAEVKRKENITWGM